MLTQQQLEALLGRPLTSTEVSNLALYLDIATKRLSSLVCFSLDSTQNPRTYDTRDGYRTAFIDPFQSINSVTIDGQAVTTFTPKQDDSYQGSWFNSLEFDFPLHGARIEVDAVWGFGASLPNDLAQVLAALFGITEQEAGASSQGAIERKKIEDFEVAYASADSSKSPFQNVISAHMGTLTKYSACEKAISHGKSVLPVYYY